MLAARRLTRRAISVALLALCGCDARRERQREARPESPPSAIAFVGTPAPSSSALVAGAASPGARSSANGSISPLRADGPFVKLAVEGFGDAVVSVPTGATSPRPVVVAVHGNYNRPDSLCEAWRPVFGEDVFVLCPRGIERDDSPSLADQRYTYDNTRDLGREIDAAVAALGKRFEGYVDDGPMVYAGFSIGAIMGVFVTAHEPRRFPRVALVEGGVDRYVPAVLDAFVKGGGERVLFICGQTSCVEDAPVTVQRLDAAGIKSECVIGPPIGHRYDGAIGETLHGALPWLLEGEGRFGHAGKAPPVPTRFN